MRNALAFIGPMIGAVGFLPYLRATIQGTVRPRIASWATWFLVTAIATIAALSERAYASSVLTGVSALLCLLIVIIALKKGDHDYAKIDGICQFLSIIGIVAWLLSNDALWAIIFNLMADFCGAVPTLYHSWVRPHEETWSPFAIGAFGSLLSIIAVETWGVVSMGFPLYLTIANGSIALIVFFRQRQLLKD